MYCGRSIFTVKGKIPLADELWYVVATATVSLDVTALTPIPVPANAGCVSTGHVPDETCTGDVVRPKVIVAFDGVVTLDRLELNGTLTHVTLS